jgi:hypothetical protein
MLLILQVTSLETQLKEAAATETRIRQESETFLHEIHSAMQVCIQMTALNESMKHQALMLCVRFSTAFLLQCQYNVKQVRSHLNYFHCIVQILLFDTLSLPQPRGTSHMTPRELMPVYVTLLREHTVLLVEKLVCLFHIFSLRCSTFVTAPVSLVLT